MNKEEIEFLREHIKSICSYKGLQQELTYDISLDILKRVCLAFNYLQQENKQLREEKEELKKWLEDNIKVLEMEKETEYDYNEKYLINVCILDYRSCLDKIKELEEGVK